MYVALALLSSLVLGSADFVGGLSARRARAAVVVVWSNLAGLLTAVVLVLIACVPTPRAEDLAWGAAAGVCGSLGAVLLYRALALGVMSLVAPTSAAAAAAIPVAAGLALGERLTAPTAIGVAAALASVVLISRTPAGRRSVTVTPHAGLVCAILAGVSFGVFLVLLAQTSPASGLWPLVSARGASLSLLVVGVIASRGSLRVTVPATRLALLSGVLDMASNAFYLAAVRGGELSVIGVLASLSPLGTVFLARLLLHERIRVTQGVGAALAVGSVMLLAARA
jgi:drug/metabolite transporter (DMT)-like permease